MIGLKKCTAALLSILLIISMTGTAVAEQSETAPREQQETVAKAADSSGVIENDDMPTGYVPDEHIAIPLLSEDWTPPELLNNPSSFDLRNVNGTRYVTSVKNQNPYGTCWSFAFCAAAESNLLMKGLGNHDLSELQLAYFTTVRNTATAAGGGGTAGDIVTDNEDLLEHGGNSYYAMETVSNWLGFADESALSYSDASSFTKVSARGVVEQDEDIAYNKDVAHVQNVYAVSLKDRSIVKQMLQTYGAATISYYHLSSYYNSDKTAYYQNGVYSTNHAVTLVGWDDNYDVSNFNSNHTPPSSNGAWLCKNSWGQDWNSNDGYFYISYEDASFKDRPNTSAEDPGQVYFVDCTLKDDYAKIYQYDGGIATRGYGYSNKSYAANVFTAESDESIAAVSFYTGSSVYSNITVSVYTSVGSGQTGDITLGSSNYKMITEQAVGRPIGNLDLFSESYYTVPLDTPVPVNAGSKFAVAVCYNSSSYAYAPYDCTAGYGGVFYGKSITSAPVAHAGESYQSANGWSWSDFSSSNGNFRIKAKTLKERVSTISGDVNCDYTVTVSDAVLIMRHIVSLGRLSAGNQGLADVNKDDRINVDDVVLICQYISGRVASLP